MGVAAHSQKPEKNAGCDGEARASVNAMNESALPAASSLRSAGKRVKIQCAPDSRLSSAERSTTQSRCRLSEHMLPTVRLQGPMAASVYFTAESYHLMRF